MRLQLAQDRNRLARQRDDVLRFHLHALGRDDPDRLIQVEFVPLRADQLAGTDERQRQQAQRVAGQLVAQLAIAVNGAQQLRQFLGRDCGLMLGLVRGERALQIGG